MKGCRSVGPDFEIPAHQGNFLLRHQPVLPHDISALIRNHVVLEAEKPNLGKRGPGNHFSWTLSRWRSHLTTIGYWMIASLYYTFDSDAAVTAILLDYLTSCWLNNDDDLKCVLTCNNITNLADIGCWQGWPCLWLTPWERSEQADELRPFSALGPDGGPLV